MTFWRKLGNIFWKAVSMSWGDSQVEPSPYTAKYTVTSMSYGSVTVVRLIDNRTYFHLHGEPAKSFLTKIMGIEEIWREYGGKDPHGTYSCIEQHYDALVEQEVEKLGKLVLPKH